MNADCLPALLPPDLKFLLDLLFETYPLYDDRDSRRAVEQVLKSLINSPNGGFALPALVDFLKTECLKKSIALVNAFVLVDWCSVFLLQFSGAPEQWAKYGLDVTLALARVLETCMGASISRRAGRIQESALVSTRRAFRSLFRSKMGEDILSKLVSLLTAKSPSSTPGNAVLLGVMAGVSSRLPAVKPALERHKQDYYAFYVREIVSSRNQLPDHISNALHDFFDSFTTLEDLRTEVIPPLEKALLRAPEVVLNDVVTPMILALPDSMDLSDVLLGNLLKPLLANIKSTNPTIRAGTLRAFQTLASRSSTDSVVDKIADEVINPLKQGKVNGVDQKVLHAQLLTALPESTSISRKIPVALVAVALKEPNEPAVVAEVFALTKHLKFGLANNIPFDKSVSDAFVKGMADKRIPVRRLWALHAADLLWDLTPEQTTLPEILSFYQVSLPKLVELWQEVIANPVPATQNGLVTVGLLVTALLSRKTQYLDDDKLKNLCKKADVVTQSLSIKPKPSFLLNPRVYSKLTSEDDIETATRALNAIAPWLAEASTSTEVREAWAHAYIFFIVAQGISTKAKVVAKAALTRVYVETPGSISNVMIAGLWSWYKLDIQGDKESAAMASKTGATELHNVLASICLPEESLKKLGASIEVAILQEQSKNLLLLARPEIVLRASWIDLCLRMGVDPGQLVRDRLAECMHLINEATLVSEYVYCVRAQLIVNRAEKISLFHLSLKQRTVLPQTWLLSRQLLLCQLLLTNSNKILIHSSLNLLVRLRRLSSGHQKELRILMSCQRKPQWLLTKTRKTTIH